MTRGIVATTMLACLLALAGPELAAQPPKEKAKTVEIDLSKLPPDLAKRLEEAVKAARGPAKDTPKEPAKETTRDAPPVKAPPAGKAISLVEAIQIAEKLTKSTATKAERKDNPQVHFKIDLLDQDGKKTKIELAADGKKLDKKD